MAQGSLTRVDFEGRMTRLYPALLLQARRTCGQDAEDVVGHTMLNVSRSYTDFSVPGEDNGGAFVNWVYTILQHAITDYHRRTRREREREISVSGVSEETLYGWESRWAALGCENDRSMLSDCELVAEVRLRMRFAELSEIERACLDGRIKGMRLRSMSKSLALSKSTICRRIKSAIEKVRASHVTAALEAFGSADLDKHAWRALGSSTIYHAPPTTGSMLAREHLAALTLKPLRRSVRARRVS